MRDTTLERRLVSINAAADYLNCSGDTVRRRIADGTLTGFRVGKRLIRVDLNEINTLMRQIPTGGNAA